MIHRERFRKRCKAEGLHGDTAGHYNMFWRAPFGGYVLWWETTEEAIYILPNNPYALTLGNRTRSAVAVFTDTRTGLDEAITTYNLLNP